MTLTPELEALAESTFVTWEKRTWLVENMGGPDVLRACIRSEILIELASTKTSATIDQWQFEPGRHSRLLHHEMGRFGPIVVVQASYTIRTMRFGSSGPIQSVVDITAPHTLLLRYSKAVMLGLAWMPRPRAILVVGLGAGSIPMFLRCFFPEAIIDVVEIDYAVVSVAKRFFNFNEDDKLRVHIDDGRHFVEHSTTTYDMVILDVYGADIMPRHMVTIESLKAVADHLAREGVVIANAWGADLNKAFIQTYKSFRAVFSQCYVAKVPSLDNRLIFATNIAQPTDCSGLTDRLCEVRKSEAIPYPLEDYLSVDNETLNAHLEQLDPNEFSPLTDG